jgi:hypothetical protein
LGASIFCVWVGIVIFSLANIICSRISFRACLDPRATLGVHLPCLVPGLIWEEGSALLLLVLHFFYASLPNSTSSTIL